MKRWIVWPACLLLLAGLLSGCGGTAEAETVGGDGDGPRIVATVFPVYDWVRQIAAGRDAETALLMDGGADLHSYQPTVDDLVDIARCDLFLYVGGVSDAWVEDALAGTENPDRRALNLLEALGGAAKEEAIAEGMQADEEDGEAEMDEHIWLSLKNARVLCGVIADALTELDPDGAAVYAANLADYDAQLAELDAAYQAAVDAASVRTLLFGDRFPFRYLADDYGLTYYAAFPGCSAETEASFETVAFLAGKVDELGLPAVLTLESGDGKIARTIVENTASKDAAVLRLDSMQSAADRGGAAGSGYLAAMEGNLEVLRAALR